MADIINPSNEFSGRCHQIKGTLADVAEGVVRAASSSMDLLDESLSTFCGGDCSICPVDLARRGAGASLDRVGSTILALTDWCESMAFQLAEATKAN